MKQRCFKMKGNVHPAVVLKKKILTQVYTQLMITIMSTLVSSGIQHIELDL